MEWLLDSPLANMFGPIFLLVYVVLVTTLIILHVYRIKSLDWTKKLPLPQIPANPDPYEIAYLRGGGNEVIRSVIFALVQRSYLTHTKELMKRQGIFSKSEKIDGIGSLTAIERDVLYYFSSPKDAGEIFNSSIRAVVSRHCMIYEEKLLKEKLLTPPEVKIAARRNAAIATAVILVIGGFKFIAAIAHGHFNVLFLIVIAIVGLLILWATTRLPRLSHRGRTYLEVLQTVFYGLKKDSLKRPQIATTQPAQTFAAVDPMLLMVGVFGVGALAGTDYGYFEQSFQRAAVQNSTSVAGCGSACGSSSCSSGGSCSGGGSCGGGGCGGGCGGCGG